MRDPFNPSVAELAQMKQLAGWEVDTWDAVAGEHEGCRAIVIGNGPSRGKLPDRGLSMVADMARGGDLVIGSNTQWHEPFSGHIGAYVCYDLGQIHQAIQQTRVPVFAPAHRIFSAPHHARGERLSPRIQEREKRRLYSISPHCAGDDVKAREGWESPLTRAIGNFSGLLAYQLAWVLGASEITLIGMDCAIEDIGDRGRRTCIDEAHPGYENSLAYKLSSCFDAGDGVLVPKSWRGMRDAWRFLTDKAADVGISTYRGYDHGSLTWLPTKAPSEPASE